MTLLRNASRWPVRGLTGRALPAHMGQLTPSGALVWAAGFC